MSSTNDITGDYLVNKKTTDAYRDNYDKIFGKKNKDVTLTKEQQAAVDDTAGIEKENNDDR